MEPIVNQEIGKDMQILAISGSLRAASSNTTLLRAAIALAPEGVEISLYDGLDGLPHFNPDLEETLQPAVRDFRTRLQAAHGVLISCPEYAHGVPGTLKNALDWVVGSGELVDKPVVLLNASPRATHAQASLKETLTVMTARIVAEASVAIPRSGKNLNDAEIISNPEISDVLRSAIECLQREMSGLPFESCM